MTITTSLFRRFAAALTLTFALSSCDDRNSSAKNEDTPPPAPESTGAYPLKVCVVSGEELGAMGKPVVINHEGTEVQFCCKECLPKFKADPDKYLAKLKAAKSSGAGESGPTE